MTDPITHEQMREALDRALAEYIIDIDRAVHFVSIEQVDMLAEFYLHNRAIVAGQQKPQHGKEVMPNDEDNSHERPAVSPRLTAGAQAIRARALEDAAQAVSDRASYWWAEAAAADDAGRTKLSLSYEAKALACIELAAVIRAMKGNTE